MQFKRVAVDTSKSVFTIHAVDNDEHPVVRRDLSRSQFQTFFSKLPPTVVVLEATGGSHHWGRLLSSMGHEVKLIPPQYVKPFVKRSKNDRNDAEAISEAASRPNMRFVPLKSAEMQADGIELNSRQILVEQRTALVNSLRGHAAEFGVVAAKGLHRVEKLLEVIEASLDVPPTAKTALAQLGKQIAYLDSQLEEIDRRLVTQQKSHPVAQLLSAVPGIGAISSLTLALQVDPKQFKSGRHFSAWLGLTPKQHSSGGKHRLGGISRAGHERIRQLLVVGAMAVVRHAVNGSKAATSWLLSLLERRPRKLAAVALANKMARIAWAMMMNGEEYRHPARTA
ncbi:IS110 family transposase [Microvirga mediterraneensis]|uniref:IS110 family transposase n=1 Tax=Microvirga mediterraneensis TaxID=2754695 RepID=A0A838BRK1_9HYPH|nr:IS110 family transposase [Microvirga mediterraneensis]MBA1157066.1 IS110 family transposase [Microvirga mediterraneensis]